LIVFISFNPSKIHQQKSYPPHKIKVQFIHKITLPYVK
jgi:hypothetical protein